MGPYCKFCNQRCFTQMPPNTPAAAIAAYRTFRPTDVVATCPAGQKHELEKFGWCLDRIKAAIATREAGNKNQLQLFESGGAQWPQ